MRKGTKQILWIGCVALGLFLAASPFLMSHAQKKSETQKVENENRDKQIAEARAAVAKSVVGTRFLATLSEKEPSWVLDKAGLTEKGPISPFTYLSMLLNKGDKLTGVGIVECDSPKDADEHFGGPTTRSYGASVPFNKYGDKSDKLIGSDGAFLSIRFRKGNFFVNITTQGDQKRAERFAEYVLKALGDAGLK